MPVGNGGFAAAPIGDDIAIAGGTTWQGDTKLWLDQIWLYDVRRNAWRSAGRLPAPLGYGVSGRNNVSWFIAGGSSGSESNQKLWRLDRRLRVSSLATLEPAFVYAAGALVGSTLYVVGGTDDQARLDRVGNAFIGINVKTGAIHHLPPYPEPGLTTATAASIGARLYVFGGARWDATTKTVVNHASAHVFFAAAKRWEALPPLPHPGRGFSAMALDHRHILVAGGYRNDEVEFVADAFIFDVTDRRYTPTTPLPYAAMVGLVKNGEWLYCLGGEDRKKHRTNAVYRIRWQELIPASP